jgi:hypothetical protein
MFRYQDPIIREFIIIGISWFQNLNQALFSRFSLIRFETYIVSTPDHTPTVIVHTAATPPPHSNELLTSDVRHWQPFYVMGCAYPLPYRYAIQREVVQLKRALYPASINLV